MASSSGDPAAARAEIARMSRLVDEKSHFAVLGIERDAPIEHAKARYVALSRKWHVDRFSGLGLDGRDLDTVDAIFKRIGQAWDALKDPEQRAEHITYLDRERAGLSTNVDAILRAESLIDEGLAAIGRKQYAEATAKLEEAAQLNPDDPLIAAHLAWARYRSAGGRAGAAREAQTALQAAVKQQENLPDAYRYLGTVAFESGELKKAIRWLDQCLEWAPKDVDATRLARLARARFDKSSKPTGIAGLWAKLTGKS